MIFRIRRRKAIRRGEERDVPPVVPDSRPADALGFEMGKMGMGHVASVSDDMDERFKRVLAMEGLRREELLAAARLNEARGRVPGLDVHVEQEVRA